MLSWLIESKSFKKCFWCSLDDDSGILTFLVTSLHSVPVTGLHVLIGTILHTFSVNGTWDHVNVSGIRILVDLDVLAEGSWLEGALLLHLLPGNLLHHPPLHRLALLGLFIPHFFDDIRQGLQKENSGTDLPDDVRANFLVNLFVRIPDHPATFLHLFRSTHLVGNKQR